MKALEDLSLQYDNSVRNSENTVVQLSYGDDGLNPDRMENNGKPIDYARLLMNVCESNPTSPEFYLGESGAKVCLKELIKEFSQEGKLPKNNDVFLNEMKHWLADTFRTSESLPMIAPIHLRKILTVAADRFTRAHVEPGEAIGATAAQSISEPATQMTLKVRNKFHAQWVLQRPIAVDLSFQWYLFHERDARCASSPGDHQRGESNFNAHHYGQATARQK